MRRPKALVRLLALFALLAVFACDRVTPVAPVGSTITLSINPSRIDAEGESAVITIIVRKEDGTPVNPGTQVSVSTTLGALDPETTFTDATGTAKSTLTGDGRIGMATVSATTGAAALVSVEVQIGSVAASITLTATPPNVPKDPQGDDGVIELTALIRDDTGAPLGGGVVNFETDTGSLDSRGGALVTDDLGKAEDVLRVTRDDISTLLEPFFLVSAETAIEGGSLIFDELEIDIRGVPATLTLQVTPASVLEAGTLGDPLRLTALVRDNLGDPLEGVGVNFLAEAGTLASEGRLIDTDADGRAVDLLSATQAQLELIPGQVFTVSAETAGLGGNLLEDSFQVRIDNSEPIATFQCVNTDPAGAGGEVDCTFTGRSICVEPDFPGVQTVFLWSSAQAPPAAPIPPVTNGNPTAKYFLTMDVNYTITLTVTDGCGTDMKNQVVNPT